MALVAQRVDVGHIQQPGVLRAMRRVAREATLSLDDRMLIHERPTCFHVALRTDRILIGGGFEVVVPKGAVGVMAIAALDHAFVHLVVKGHVERWLYVGVTLEAQVRLLCQEQGRVRRSFVDAVAAKTTHTRLGMRGAEEVGMSISVAAQAGRIDLLRGELIQLDDLGDIATGFHMRLASAMAAFAGSTCSAMLKRKFGVRVVGHACSFGSVARCTGIIPDKIRGVCICLGCRMPKGLGGDDAGTACGQEPGHCNQKETRRNSAGQMTHRKTPQSAELV